MARVEYADVILQRNGMPHAGATVTIAVHPGAAGSSTLYAAEVGAGTLASVVTDATGRFVVWLEEGRYDVSAAGETQTIEMIHQGSVGGGVSKAQAEEIANA